MVYLVLKNIYYERDISDPIVFCGIDVIGIFKNDLKVVEFLRRVGVNADVSNLPSEGKCVDLPSNLVVCNAYSDL